MEMPETRHAWDALAGYAAEPNPFHESWCLLPALRTFDPARGVKLLRFECDGELAGLLPLYRESRQGGWPVPRLVSWSHAHCFLGAPLVAAGLERQFWEAMLNWVDRKTRIALCLHFVQLPLDGPLYAALQATLGAQDRRAAVTRRENRAMLSSSLSPDAYFEHSLSDRTREELRRQFARLSELGEVRIERRTDAERLLRWTEDFLALEHARAPDPSGGASLAARQSTARLFREALSGAASYARLERLALLLDDEPIAMLANFITPPGAYLYRATIDERYARYAPDALLQHANLDLLDHPRVRWCDSAAVAKEPLIGHIWHERRPIGDVSIAIGGKLRQAAFAHLLKARHGLAGPNGAATG